MATTYLNTQENSRYGTEEGTPVEEDAKDGQHDGEDKVIRYVWMDNMRGHHSMGCWLLLDYHNIGALLIKEHKKL